MNKENLVGQLVDEDMEQSYTMRVRPTSKNSKRSLNGDAKAILVLIFHELTMGVNNQLCRRFQISIYEWLLKSVGNKAV